VKAQHHVYGQAFRAKRCTRETPSPEIANATESGEIISTEKLERSPGLSYLKCARCGEWCRWQKQKAKGNKSKATRRTKSRRERLRAFLCTNCLQLDLAKEGIMADHSNTPRDQRDVTSRLNIWTRYHGWRNDLLPIREVQNSP